MTAAAAVGIGAVVAAPIALLAAVVLSATSGAVSAGVGCAGDGGPGGGQAQIDRTSFSAEQMTNVQTITSVVAGRRMPGRAAVIAVTAALVESDLRNTTSGDRDSLGLFQERPSQGWGTPEDILNPVYATQQFLDHLVAVPGWITLPPGAAEQDVERSAFPERYAPQEPVATLLVTRFLHGQTVSTGCADQGSAGGPAAAVSLPAAFTLPVDPQESAAVAFAIAQLGKPYVWGAKGPNAFDCSGLVQAAWAAAGVALDADTADQVHDGVQVSSLAAVQPGDLLFIPGSLGTAAHPRHVGLYAGHGLVINAYDTDKGVIAQPLAAWSAQIVAIRRPGPGSRP
jgi:cell wall-associated NlpC family hydrolase